MMKKINKLLISFLIVLFSVFFLLHENHIHIEAAPDFGVCPVCGQPRIGGYIDHDPTCTEGASYECWCDNPSCDAYGSATGGYTPALGHDYIDYVITQASCTTDGVVRKICQRCENYYDEKIPAWGHSYQSSVTKAATCTETGIRTYTCSRCSDSYTETIAALGHNYEYEETEATCTEEGHKIGTCKRCGNVTEEIYPALGHDLEYVVTKQPTCTEEGQREVTCKRCGEKFTEKILAFGHRFPKEWTIEKEAGLFTEGLKTKTCEYCGLKLEEKIPAKLSPTVIIGGAGGLLLAGAGLLLGFKAFGKKKNIVEEAGEKKSFKPSIETKTIVIDSVNEKLIKLLKGQSYLKVKTVKEEDDVSAVIEENEPDLFISDISDKEKLTEILKQKEEKYPDTPLGLLLDKKAEKGNVRYLKKLKEDKTIVDYISADDSPYKAMVKLILPILKPELNSDETLDNIGKIADLLGIPGVSTVINVYVSGRDIKATLEEDELGVVEHATIIGDIASIMGWDTVGNVAGLVNDVDAIKSALTKEGGAYEKKKGVKAVKDINEVVGDLKDQL